jgi:hypothetical protein
MRKTLTLTLSRSTRRGDKREYAIALRKKGQIPVFLDTRPRAPVFSPRSLELTLTMLFEDRLWLRLA